MTSKRGDLYKTVQRRLIGSLLSDGSTINQVLELINEDDIEEPKYNVIFQSISDLARRDEVISTISVAENLQNLGKLSEIGGTAELYNLHRLGQKYLIEATPVIYARIIKDSSAKSKISRSLEEYGEYFTDDSGVSASEAVSDLQSTLSESLVRLSNNSTITRISDDIDSYYDLLEERLETSIANKENSDGLQGIPSLLPTLNKYTTGWTPGQLITVGARTGVGKTVMAVNCALAGIKANATVMFFSLEMGKIELIDRFLAASTGISMNRLKQGNLTEEDKRALNEEIKEIKNANLVIDVEPKITVDMIRARAVKQAQKPEGLDMIIVDYLQLITAPGRFGSRQEQVADISRNMKLLAKQLEVPIMVLVQLNREKDGDNDIPKLDQIRESGAIAQDSDIVILLHRDHTLDDYTPPTKIILAKNRNGESNKTIVCHSNLECSLFREITRKKDIEDDVIDDDLILDDFDNEEEDFTDFDFS